MGGHSGKFRKVPWYFFVIPFVKEVGGWFFSEISKSQHMFHQKSTCTPPDPKKIFREQRKKPEKIFSAHSAVIRVALYTSDSEGRAAFDKVLKRGGGGGGVWF